MCATIHTAESRRLGVSVSRALVAGGRGVAGPSAGAFAGTIAGTVTFPSQFVPSMTVYASDLDTSRIHTVQLARGQVNFTVEVPPGRYLVFLAPNEPGAPDVYGALHAVQPVRAACVADGACEDHALIPVAVTAKAPHAAVTIDDWYLTDDIADQWTASAARAGAALPIGTLERAEILRIPERIVRDIPRRPRSISAAANCPRRTASLCSRRSSGGPNFAGHVTVTLTRCGPACGRLVLIDWRSGAIQVLPPPGSHSRDPGNSAVPCRRGRCCFDATAGC